MERFRLQAHRGVSTDYPENTMAAFRGAIEQDCEIIELDPNFTADGVFIVLHDDLLERTGRKLNGDQIEKPIMVGDITYQELGSYEFGSWFDPKFAGEKAPLFEDVLKLSEETGILLKIDNKFEWFPAPYFESFLDLIESHHANIAFTSTSVDRIKRLRARFSNAEIHYDGYVDEDVLKQLVNVVGREKLTVWLPYQNDKTTWVKIPFVSKELADLVKRYADLGIWILSTEEEYVNARNYGANAIETTGSIKPHKN